AYWKTKPISRLTRAVSGTSPNTVILPLDGSIRSAMTRNKVDLPQPEGPSSVRKLPRGIVRSMFSSAVTVPRSVVKRTLTRSQSTASGVSAASIDPADRLADLGALRLGGVEDLAGDHILELGRAGAELLQVVVELDLLGPDRRIESAPAIGRRVAVEGEGEQRLAALDLVVALEVGIFLDQEVDRLIGVLERVLPALRYSAGVGREHVGLLLDRVLGGVIGQRVEPHASIP